MKVAPILRAIEQRGTLEAVLVHTGQHYDAGMSEVFFADLGIRAPDIHLGIGAGSHAEQTGRVMMAFEQLCLEDRPDLVLVVGDVNATVACSLAAAKLHIPVAHVEAGLRSGDRGMPEEINRIVTDALADLLFTTEPAANENLAREGVAAGKVHFVGNVMVDSLLASLGRSDPPGAVARILGPDFAEREFALLTLHRPANVDDPGRLARWVEAFEAVAARIPIVCPLHPRTAGRLEAAGLRARFEAAVAATGPLGYLEFIGLMQRARLVITDSGGLQEEATVLGVPCLTIRANTERPVTLTAGSNRLVGDESAALAPAVAETLAQPRPAAAEAPELWDGRAAERIVAVLERHLAGGAGHG